MPDGGRVGAHPPNQGDVRQFFGKYRGKVLDNVDPLFQGRIKAEVPAVSGAVLNWALPCTPYAGPDVGFYAIPPIGANIWMEFEGGDPNYPIWAGCFWGPEDLLHVPEPPPPEVKVFKTEHITMVLSDVPEEGGFTLECKAPAVDVPLTMIFNSEGIKILCPEATVKMTPETITLTVPESVMEMMAETISLTVPESEITLTAEMISVAVPASSIEISGELIEVEAPTLSVDALSNFSGVVNIEPLLAVEGDTNVAGALTVEGEANFALLLTAEGDVNIAGGLTIEGGGEIDGFPII